MKTPKEVSAQQIKAAQKLVEDDLDRVAGVQKRLAETQKFVRAKGRIFEDGDPKRDAQSPLGGRVW